MHDDDDDVVLSVSIRFSPKFTHQSRQPFMTATIDYDNRETQLLNATSMLWVIFELSCQSFEIWKDFGFDSFSGILIPLFLLAGALGTKLASLSKAAPAGPWERPNNIPLRQYPYSLHVGSV